MAYKYIHKTTGKIVEQNKPMDKKKKQDYKLLSYSTNMMIKSSKVTKK